MSEPVKRGRGQPTKYRPEYCEMLIKHMSEGLSFECFGAVIDVNQDTLHEWVKVQPAFSEAKKVAYGKSRLFWEKLGLTGTIGKIKGFQPATYIFTMKNRFRWTDRVQVESTDIDPITLGYDPMKLLEVK